MCATASKFERIMITLFRILAALVLLACLAPIAAVTYVAIMAQTYGCVVHEGFVNPCVVDGVDIGQRLYTLGMMGWLLLVTLPAFVATALIWIVVETVRWIVRRRVAAAQK